MPINWEYLENEKQMQDPEVIKLIYEKGVPDEFMAETVMREFVRKGRRALIYTTIQHAFTSFRTIEYAEKARKVELGDDRRAGNIVYDRIGDEAATVLFHSPWPYKRAQALVTYPADGAIDRLMENLSDDTAYVYAGFDTHGTPFGELDSDRNDFSYGYDERLSLADFCDGYIITGPIGDYETVTLIPGFINDSNIAEAIARFPGPNIDSVTVDEMNSFIAGVLDSRAKIIDRF